MAQFGELLAKSGLTIYELRKGAEILVTPNSRQKFDTIKADNFVTSIYENLFLKS